MNCRLVEVLGSIVVAMAGFNATEMQDNEMSRLSLSDIYTEEIVAYMPADIRVPETTVAS